MNKFFLYLSLMILILTSCKKYEFDLVGPIPTIEGTEWVLVNGRAYTENLTSGALTYYNHFSINQTVSNLDIFGGSSTDVDNIEQGVTTWHFENGIFTLDNNITYEYNTHGSGSKTQYTLIGVPPYGSARNLGILDFNSNVLHVKIYESNESHNGDNYHYYTILTFVRLGYDCPSCVFISELNYTYGGILNLEAETTPGHLQLIGTSWVITRYDDGLTPVYPNDTLNFISGVTYSINGYYTNTYSFSNNIGNNMYNLTLYECVTLGGNYSGHVGLSFIDVGELNNLTMNGIFGTPGSMNVWLERIN